MSTSASITKLLDTIDATIALVSQTVDDDKKNDIDISDDSEISRINRLLATFYKSMNDDTYYKTDKKGKFLSFCIKNGLTDDQLKQQLFMDDPSACIYCKFDKKMPWGEYCDGTPLPTVSKSNSEIDKCLNDYYRQFGRTDYYDANGVGKFSQYMDENGYSYEDIQDELDGTAEDSALVDIDDKFPIKNSKHLKLKEMQLRIFRVIKCCINNGYSPLSVNAIRLRCATLDEIYYILKYCFIYNRAPKVLMVFSDLFTLFDVNLTPKELYFASNYNLKPVDKMDKITMNQAISFFKQWNTNDGTLKLQKFEDLRFQITYLQKNNKSKKTRLKWLTNDVADANANANADKVMDDNDFKFKDDPNDSLINKLRMRQLKRVLCMDYDDLLLLYLNDSYNRDRMNRYKQSGFVLKIPIWVNKSEVLIPFKGNFLFSEYKATGYITALFRNKYQKKLTSQQQYNINDKMEDYANYVSVWCDFINNYLLNYKNNDNIIVCKPFSIDFIIAVKDIKDLNDSDDDIYIPGSDDEQKEKKDIDWVGKVKAKLKREKLVYIKQNIPNNGPNINELIQFYAKFKRKLSLNDCDTPYPGNRRFCMFFDRRQQQHEMIMYQPPDNCNVIPTDTELRPQSFFDLSKCCMIPAKGYNKGICDKKIISKTVKLFDKTDGQLLSFSFHIESSFEMRCYLSYNGQVHRFYPEDIIDIFPLIFDEYTDNNKKWMKSDDAKKLVNNIDIKDVYFETFYKNITINYPKDQQFPRKYKDVMNK